MRPSIILFALCVLLFPAGPADSEEPEPAASPLELTLELDDAAPGYGTTIRITAVITNRSERPVPFFSDTRQRGLFRLELEDRNGFVWTPAKHPIRILHTFDSLDRSLDHLLGGASTLAPGQHLRLTFDVEWFVPRATSKQPHRWLSHLPPGAYSVRLVYAKQDIFVPGGRVKSRPRLLRMGPISMRRAIPGLFTGRMEATAKLSVTVPSKERVDALRARVHELEQENARLEKVIQAVRAALPAT